MTTKSRSICCAYHERIVHDHLDDGLGLWLYFVIKVRALTWQLFSTGYIDLDLTLSR